MDEQMEGGGKVGYVDRGIKKIWWSIWCSSERPNCINVLRNYHCHFTVFVLKKVGQGEGILMHRQQRRQKEKNNSHTSTTKKTSERTVWLTQSASCRSPGDQSIWRLGQTACPCIPCESQRTHTCNKVTAVIADNPSSWSIAWMKLY